MNTLKAKVVILPTDNQYTGILCKSPNGTLSTNILTGIPQHLYITTDDKIKERDWVLYDVAGYNNSKYNSHFLGQVTSIKEIGQANCHYGIDGNKLGKNLAWHCEDCKKIIATTDKLVIKDYENCNHEKNYLPRPSIVFVDKYCKEGGIDEVLVEYKEKLTIKLIKGRQWGDAPGANNPKGRPFYMKSYGYLPKINSHNTITIHSIKNNWNRKEVEELLLNMGLNAMLPEIEINNWIKENL